MGVSRVTHRSMSEAALRGIQDAMARTKKYQDQLSSGRRLTRPGDDPSATASSMKLRSQKRADEQYLRNISDATGRLGITDSTLVGIGNQIHRARDLLVSARSGVMSDEGRVAIAAELSVIRDSVIGLYNTRWLDRPVFGGTAPGDVAVDASGGYIGDDGEIVSRISRDATLRIDVRGTDVAADLLPGTLEQAAEDVLTDSDNIGDLLGELDEHLSAVLKGLGDVGARAAALETTKANLDSEKIDFTARISQNEDVDMPEAIMHLESQRVAYEAALGAAARVLQTSLADFLR